MQQKNQTWPTTAVLIVNPHNKRLKDGDLIPADKTTRIQSYLHPLF